MMNFPSNHQATIMCKPSHGSFNLPTMAITPKFASILDTFKFTTPYRSHQINATIAKSYSQRLRIITRVCYQMLWRFPQTFKDFIDMRLFVWAGQVKGHCQRNSLAVRHHHELRTLATPCNVDFRAPFLALTKWLSIKHWAHWIFLRLSNCLMKCCQILSHTPSSSHNFKRLQQVLGLGYSLGKSFQRAPLRNTQRIPSKTKRLFFQGRPLLFNFGSSGSIFSHCFWLKYTARLIGLFPPMSLLSTISYKDL